MCVIVCADNIQQRGKRQYSTNRNKQYTADETKLREEKGDCVDKGKVARRNVKGRLYICTIGTSGGVVVADKVISMNVIVDIYMRKMYLVYVES